MQSNKVKLTDEKSDQLVLKILKENKYTIYRILARTMGLETWYDGFYESDIFADLSIKERFIAADNFNRLKYTLDRLLFETNLCEGCGLQKDKDFD